MCGIAGIILKSAANVSGLEQRLGAMAQAMAYRGPDDEGIYLSADGRIGFVNRRLAIRDLSQAGHMPMSNSAADVWITYNGEIYNANELRVELEEMGYAFHSSSDTEVILHGYEAWGSDVVVRLRGMFAFAIEDRRKFGTENPLILIARDHMGIKPVYYCETEEAFIFASELKTLFASGLVNREISPTGLVGYLLMGSIPNPNTIYDKVWALEPSNLLEVKLVDSLNIQKMQYWALPEDTAESYSKDEAVQRIRALLREAVRICLVSDVPLGAFLSGGLDSSSIVALMRQATNGEIRTCSMVFEEGAYSEAPYARAVANAVGAQHSERVITFDDVIHEFDNILAAMDQPTIDGVNTYFVSQTARQAGLTVALSGLGGDELFGGYPNSFREAPKVLQALQIAQHVPKGRELAHAAINLLPNAQNWSRVQDALQRSPSLASAYLTRRGLFSPSEVQTLVHPDVWQASEFDPVHYVATKADAIKNDHANTFAWISRAELRTYTNHQLLRDTDVMSMIHSLEVRVPLLDTELVSFSLRLPERLKTGKERQPKALLSEAMAGLLPATVQNRQDKQGFTFPFAEWLRGGLAERTRSILEDVKADPHINAAAVDSIIERFECSKVHWSRLWALVALSCTI